MNPLEVLVRCGPTELARLGRAALNGLAATLEAGLAASPGDPAGPACRAAVDYLRTLTLGEAGRRGTAPPAGPGPTAEPLRMADSWPSLRDSWARSREWADWIGNATFSEDAELPRRLWLLTHRLPPDSAREWQREWLRTAGLTEDAPAGSVVAGPFDTLLCPRLPDGTAAVRMSLAAAPDSRLGALPTEEIARRLAPVVSALLWFVEVDSGLRHSLRTITRFGVAPVPGPHRPRYQKTLLDRFEAVRKAEDEADMAGLVLGWAELDEAAHSLTYEPAPHAGSTFSLIVCACRDTLGTVRDRATAAGSAVHLQVPTGRYADCRGLTDPESDLETTSGVAPGEIARCIRVFVRLDGTAYPGRVTYRPR